MDVRSGRELRSYSAVGFAACEAQSKVAIATGMEMSGKEFVRVNGAPVYSIPHGSSVFSIRWFADCSHLVFTEGTNEGFLANAATLVVLSGESVEARIPVRAGYSVYAPVGSTFVIGSSTFLVDGESAKALLYDTTTHTLRPALHTLELIQEREAAEQQVMKTLGGQSPDWYRLKSE